MGQNYLDVCIRYVSHHIVLVVDDSQGGNALVIHQPKGIIQGLIATGGTARQLLPMQTANPSQTYLIDITC